jgi:hypothetical protein
MRNREPTGRAEIRRRRPTEGAGRVTLRDKSLVGLLVLGFFDVVLPLPVIGLLLAYVVVVRPAWFRALVLDIYEEV